MLPRALVLAGPIALLGVLGCPSPEVSLLDAGTPDASIEVRDASGEPTEPDGGEPARDAGLPAPDASEPQAIDAGSCTPETKQLFCDRHGSECGPTAGFDTCARQRTEDCGDCAEPLSCRESRCRECRPDCAGRTCGDDGCRGACGTCPSGTSCHPERFVCTSCIGTCAGKACGDDGCGDSCGSCAPGEQCHAGRCVAVAPVNDGCASAIPLVLDASGSTRILVDTTLATDSHLSPSCQSGGGAPDVVYSLTLSEPSNVSLALASPMADVVPLLAVDKACPAAPQDELSCRAEGWGPYLVLERMEPGTYYVWVDDAAQRSGLFELSASVTPAEPAPPVPTNDGCSGAIALSLDSSGYATVEMDTTLATRDSSSPVCIALPDVVYSLTLSAVSNVKIRLTPPVIARPSLAVLDNCTPAPPKPDELLACQHTVVSGQPAELTLEGLAPGTYFVWAGVQTGVSRLDVQVDAPPEPPANDSCSGAEPIVLGPTGEAFIHGSTRAATNGPGTLLCYAPGHDVVYSLDLPEASDVELLLMPAPGMHAALYAKSDCVLDDPSRGGVACARSSSENVPVALNLPAAGPGLSYLWIDALDYASGGDFLLAVATKPLHVPPNDTCRTAEPLCFTNGVASVHGNSTLAHDDLPASCAYAETSADVVYGFTIAEERSLIVEVNPHERGFALSLHSDCSGRSTSELACSNDDDVLSISRLAPGTYYLAVERSAGEFDLMVRLGALYEVPTNEDCASAAPLVFDGNVAQVSSTTRWANADMPGCLFNWPEPDLVWRLRTTEPHAIRAEVVPRDLTVGLESPDLFWPIVSIRTDCAQRQDLACGYGHQAFTEASVLLPMAPPGEYLVVVEGLDASRAARGDFDLKVTLEPPQLPPANIRCSTAAPLDLSQGFARVHGTTIGAPDAAVLARCYDGPGGPTTIPGSAAYQFTLAAPARVKAKVKATSGSLAPVVFLQSTCGSQTADLNRVGCAIDQVGTGEAVAIGSEAAPLPPGTYYVWIGSSPLDRATQGEFDLELDILSPVPNDSCATAISVNLAQVVQGSTSGAENDFGKGPFSQACEPWRDCHAGGANCTTCMAPDVFYRFRPPTTGSYEVELATAASFSRPSLAVIDRSCDMRGGSCQAMAAPLRDVWDLKVPFHGVAGEDVCLVVDGCDVDWHAQSMGDFSLVVRRLGN
ncbi:MAG: hypothetical protein HY901_15880 [Deltaproteobacteria bacterium]|nr:hypothetical protein [Deltaproteobacteria bacterium]